MPPTLTQANRPLQATTPLGPNDLVPIAFEGMEAVSAPYAFVVDFASTNAAIAASSVLGKPIGISVKMDGGRERLFHGLVRRFASRGQRRDFALYRAELVPTLWLLSLASDCRTFEEMSPLEVVEKVLKESGVSNLKMKVTAPPKKAPFIVQYRETNLAFVSRLLEESGLYYYHEHEKDQHMLVISDAHAGSIPAGKVAEVKLSNALTAETVEVDAVADLAREFRVHSKGVSLLDHDLLRAPSSGSANSANPGASGELFDFLGDLGPNDSAGAAKRLIEGAEAEHDRFEGGSTCASFEAGSRVKVSGGVLGNAGSELHLLEVRHRVTTGDIIASSGLHFSYRNEFGAMLAATRFRPAQDTDKPSVQGTQVAKIVGSGGAAEIDVDANGCVLLQFAWDRGAGSQGKSRHRVHVASAWAGTGWGFVQLPRIGQEVLVEFLEGDPDRPIVTGRVYNGTHKHPYALPAAKTQSGWKSRTLGGGTSNFNELRFDDKKGEEQVFAQAEKNLDVLVKNAETRTVGLDRTTVIENHETRTVKKGDDKHTIEKGDHLFTVSEGDHTLLVTKGEQKMTVEKGITTAVNDGDLYTEVIKGNHLTHVQDGNWAANAHKGNALVDAKKKITIKAGDEIVLECGQATMSLKKDGTIAIKGMKISIEGSAKVEIKGAQVKVEGSAQAEIKAAIVKVEGSGMTTIKGAITQVTGSGMLKAGGGITMLG
jgi:type VI secretion system secreted protein VgrG